MAACLEGGDTILTYNDFTAPSVVREAFILKAIDEYKSSKIYERAATAQEYYSTDNTAIGKRMGYLERQMQSKINIKFHRLRCAFFPKAVKRLVLYLMGNGTTLEDSIKLKIDRKFDNTLILAAVNACVDGVVWGFADLDKLTFFRATEFAPLFDERTSKPMAGIRFWQIDPKKPMYIELYERDGKTEYKVNDSGTGLTEIASKRPYKQNVRKYPDPYLPDETEGNENYDVLPIFPLYANELKTSELTTGLQALIDAYDFTSSDWVDNTTLVEGLYGIIKNYGGQDAAALLAEIQQLKVIVDDNANGGAELKAIEMPYQSRDKLLEFLEKRMYNDFMIPSDTSGRQVTATEIKAAREELEVKADLLEWQIAEFVDNVLRLKGHDEPLPSFKRRTMNNDNEAVENIATQLNGGWIDAEQAIKLDPTIPQEDKEKLTARIALLATGVPDDGDSKKSEEDSDAGNNLGYQQR